MTLIVGWLACDQRGPCSAYIASDSRISDNRNFYDYSQKTFALKNTPDIRVLWRNIIYISDINSLNKYVRCGNAVISRYGLSR